MSLFQEAARLNNVGVASLQQGDYDAAIHSMGDSIHRLQQDLSSVRWSSPPSYMVKSNFTLQILSRIEIVEIVPKMMLECSVSPSTVGTLTMFNEAVKIPEVDAHPAHNADVNIYSSAVLYNLALVHQLAASSQKGDASRKFLGKAEKLYTMVLKLLDNDTALVNVRTTLILQLASINNLSQMYYARGEYKTAKQGLEQISRFMRYHPSSQAIFSEAGPAIQALILNALLGLKAPTAASAA